MIARVLTVVCGLAALRPAAASACHVDPFSFVFGTDSESHMTLRNAESCRFGFHANSRSQVASFSVAQAPQHGTLTQADKTHWLYHPARGFTGQDAVVIRLSGEYLGNRRTSSGDTNITWTIDVSP